MAVAERRLGRERRSLEALTGLEPLEVAAYFIARRSEGLTGSEQGQLDHWLAAHLSHRLALARAESAWAVFDGAGDNEILKAMRAHALASRPRIGAGWRLAAMAAVVVVLLAAILIGGVLLAF